MLPEWQVFSDSKTVCLFNALERWGSSLLNKSQTRELPLPTHLRVAGARLAQLGEDRSAKQKDTNLNLGSVNNQCL